MNHRNTVTVEYKGFTCKVIFHTEAPNVQIELSHPEWSIPDNVSIYKTEEIQDRAKQGDDYSMIVLKAWKKLAKVYRARYAVFFKKPAFNGIVELWSVLAQVREFFKGFCWNAYNELAGKVCPASFKELEELIHKFDYFIYYYMRLCFYRDYEWNSRTDVKRYYVPTYGNFIQWDTHISMINFLNQIPVA